MKNYDVTDYGAVGDGVTDDIRAIRNAIDHCRRSGGGRVSLAEGTYLCGGIRLYSHTDLHLSSDATLLMSTDPGAFPIPDTQSWKTERAPRNDPRCFIYAERCSHVSITGEGRIDCQGRHYVEPIPDINERHLWLYRRRKLSPPPRMVLFMGCTDVTVESVCMTDPASGWSFWVCDCERVQFRGIRILSDLHYPNADGIHINCSRDVTVSDCVIRCGDDAIVVRAYTGVLHCKRPCERITVTNCTLTSYAHAIRIGWINDGIIRNCIFSDLVITNSNGGIGITLPRGKTEPLSDQGDDETLIEHLLFENIVMDRHYHDPINIKIDENNRVAAIRDITFSNIRAISGMPPSFYDRADCHLKDITLSNCSFTIRPVTEHYAPPPGIPCYTKDPGTPDPLLAYADRFRMENVTFSPD